MVVVVVVVVMVVVVIVAMIQYCSDSARNDVVVSMSLEGYPCLIT